MGVMKDSSGKNGRRDYAQFALLGAVPAIMIAGPAVGFFAGQWADGKFGTDPWLQIVGVVLGFGAAGVEIAGLVKKSQALEKEIEKEDKADNGS
jgi:F0F1-type ATP synthase assembly protein I